MNTNKSYILCLTLAACFMSNPVMAGTLAEYSALSGWSGGSLANFDLERLVLFFPAVMLATGTIKYTVLVVGGLLALSWFTSEYIRQDSGFINHVLGGTLKLHVIGWLLSLGLFAIPVLVAIGVCLNTSQASTSKG